MTAVAPNWLIVERRDAPLIVSIPHAGTELLGFEPAFERPAQENWPTPIETRAAPTRDTLKRVVGAILSEVSGS
jgi:hypothetical protein